MKQLAIIYTALFFLLLLVSCSGDGDKEEQTQIIEDGDTQITLDIESGKTVFELLQAQHQIEFSQSAQGVFVLSINTVKNEGGKAWRYFINDKPGNVACDKAVVFEGDVVQWRYE